MQFIAEFIIESVQNPKRICNEKTPPMDLKTINKNWTNFTSAAGYDKMLAQLWAGIKGMEDAFHERGNLKKWHPHLLEMINKCFVNHYMHKGDPVLSLFFLDSKDNKVWFLQYCDGINQALQLNASIALKYALKYFSFYVIWQLRGYGFPVPLGTTMVVKVLYTLMTRVLRGFTEVHIYSHAWWAACSLRPHILARNAWLIENGKLHHTCSTYMAVLHPQAYAGPMMSIDFMPMNT